jgi:peptidoglycan/LPS O-acetylase OafA/YrhL
VSETTKQNPATWLPGIEALRAIAAGIVVIHHCWSLGTQPRFPAYWAVEGFGSLGVNVFFLLSGYLLPDYFWRPKGMRPLLPFYVRRIMRIVPAYYVNLVVLVLFFVPATSWFTRRGAKQIFANATFTHFWWPGTSSSFNANGALWTLTIEMALYLVMPLLALSIGRKPFLATGLFVLVGIGWRVMLGINGNTQFRLWFKSSPGFDRVVGSLFIGRQFFGFLPIFALGILIKRLDSQGRLTRLRLALPPLSLPALLLLLAPATVWLVFIERASVYSHWLWFSLHDHLMVVLAVPALILAAKPLPGAPSRPMSFFTWLGERSYGLYLWHFPIVLSLYARGSAMTPASTSHLLIRLIIIFALSMLFAHVSFVAIERPAQGFGRRIVARLNASRSSIREVTL